ncbi:MAG: hypothetical protein KGL96_15345, partial [Hyphomicrobiales bacterium]|nr:hypothetical protein [Hyphomicrobiales bacterium]
MRKHAVVIAALVVACCLSGCARSTGVLPAGPDTYTLTERVAPIAGGADAAEAAALQKANEFCAAKGRVFVANTMGITPAALGAAP